MLITLDNSNPHPLYQQIVDQVRTRILAGDLGPGDQLPSIRQLAAELLTSVMTTKRAYQDLEAAGLIQTRAGRGTYVCEIAEPLRQRLRLTEVEDRLREAVRAAARLGIRRRQLQGLLERVMEAEGLQDE